MLLDDLENTVLAKLIAIINGVTAEGDISKLEPIVFEVCRALKNKNNLSYYIDYLAKLKKELLPDCIICAYPCGRTNDFYLNSLDDSKKDKKISEYKKFIDIFNDDMSYNDVLYNLSKLSW